MSHRHFHHVHNRAIDEVWYKRAVEHSYVDAGAYVYSVPHEAGELYAVIFIKELIHTVNVIFVGDANNTLVTVSAAIFKEDGGKKAPVAVVGYQFYHSSLHSIFRKTTISVSC